MNDKRFLHVEIDPLAASVNGVLHTESNVETLGTEKEQILMLAIAVSHVAENMKADYRELLLALAAAGPIEPTSGHGMTIEAPLKKGDMP